LRERGEYGLSQWNKGNYNKYHSKNPLKRYMVHRLNSQLITLVQQYVREIAKDKNIVKILDVGCGEGFISGLVQAHCKNVEITGVDYAKEALDIARSLNRDITFIEGSIYQIPFEEKSFDIVLCTEVLEHLQNPVEAATELQRVAKRYLLVTVPEEPWFCVGNILALKNVFRLGNPIDHINHWTFRGFKRFWGGM